MRPLSRHIDARSAKNIIEARKHAEEIGRQLNRFYTINSYHTSFEGDDVSKAWQGFLKNRYARALRDFGKKHRILCPPTYTWVIENKNGRLHIHWLMHMDANFKQLFEKRVVGWVTKEFGQVYDVSSAINSKPASNPQGAINYILKGMRKGAANLYNINAQDAGEVRGKRAGHSRNLGPTAIERYWKAREAPLRSKTQRNVA